MTETKIVEVLRDARQRITPENCWTRQAKARDSDGNAVEVNDLDAISWCGRGSLLLSAEFQESIIYTIELTMCQIAARSFGQPGIMSVNDKLGHEAVLQLFDAAIVEFKNK